MRCSVVIPTCNRPALLARVLEALANQTLEADEFEVLVCDDSPNDATRSVVSSAAAKSAAPILYRTGRVHTQGAAAMRNLGWRIARGEIIAFTNDDTVPDPDWLRQGLIALHGDAADAASGRISVPLPNDPTDYERDVARLERAGFVAANCFCTRLALACVGGFDTAFHAAWREDSDLYFKLIEHGFDVVEAIDAVVERPIDPAPWGASLRAESKHAFDALLYKKHPALYAQFIRPHRPLLYYGILLSLLVALAGAFGESTSFVVAGVVAWLLLTAWLVARRLDGTTRQLPHVVEVVITSLAIPALSVFHRLRGGIAFRVGFW